MRETLVVSEVMRKSLRANSRGGHLDSRCGCAGPFGQRACGNIAKDAARFPGKAGHRVRTSATGGVRERVLLASVRAMQPISFDVQRDDRSPTPTRCRDRETQGPPSLALRGQTLGRRLPGNVSIVAKSVRGRACGGRRRATGPGLRTDVRDPRFSPNPPTSGKRRRQVQTGSTFRPTRNGS